MGKWLSKRQLPVLPIMRRRDGRARLTNPRRLAKFVMKGLESNCSPHRVRMVSHLASLRVFRAMPLLVLVRRLGTAWFATVTWRGKQLKLAPSRFAPTIKLDAPQREVDSGGGGCGVGLPRYSHCSGIRSAASPSLWPRSVD